MKNYINLVLILTLVNITLTPLTSNPEKWLWWDVLAITFVGVVWVVVHWKQND